MAIGLLPEFVRVVPSRGPEGPALRVLCVDEPDAADSLAALLSLAGFDALVRYDGQAGLSAARSARPDVCVMDVQLPLMDGYELARRIRAELGPAVLLVAVTGWTGRTVAARAAAAGFDRLFTKPADPGVLIALCGAAGSGCQLSWERDRRMA